MGVTCKMVSEGLLIGYYRKNASQVISSIPDFFVSAPLSLRCSMQDLCWGMWTLSCGIWDLLPLLGIEPRLSCFQSQVYMLRILKLLCLAQNFLLISSRSTNSTPFCGRAHGFFFFLRSFHVSDCLLSLHQFKMFSEWCYHPLNSYHLSNRKLDFSTVSAP